MPTRCRFIRVCRSSRRSLHPQTPPKSRTGFTPRYPRKKTVPPRIGGIWRSKEIRTAQEENRFPLIVGGTGFYLKTLLEGISPIPDVAASFRAEAAALQKKLGNPGFHEELARRDPLTAAKLDPLNTQRLVRAFEVLLATGKSLAEWQSVPRTGTPGDLHFLTAILQPPREILYAACDGRFGKMLEMGALEEAKQFSEQSLLQTRPCPKRSATLNCLHYLAGKTNLAEAVTLAQQSTRNYAKRQTTWFRHQIHTDILLESPDPAPLLSRLKAGF